MSYWLFVLFLWRNVYSSPLLNFELDYLFIFGVFTYELYSFSSYVLVFDHFELIFIYMV